MINSNFPPSYKLFCQMWFPNKREPVVVETSGYFNILQGYWKKELRDILLYSYLITCPIPKKFKNQKPTYISLVEKKCDIATNILTVSYNKPNKSEENEEFAVCVKMLDFLHEDWSVRAVEWIEMLRILGANKIFFYTLKVNENMMKVFEYYKQQGTVEVVPITLGGYQPNANGFRYLYMYSASDEKNYYQRTLHELISLNDCFYKNMYKYKFLSSLDLDEVIVPLKEHNWTALVDKLVEQSKNSTDTRPVSAFLAVPTIFSPICDNSTEWNEDISSYMYILQHVLHYDFPQKASDNKVFY